MQAIIAGIIRHFITTAGGAGALQGAATDDPVVTAISVIFIAGGLGWSVIQKLWK